MQDTPIFSRRLSRLFFTAGLLFCFAQLIVWDYQKIKLKPVVYSPAAYFVVSAEKVDSQARTLTLNRLLPKSFNHLLAFADHKEKFDREKFEEYSQYYKKVVEYLPQRADAWEMLGYCSYQLGKSPEALVAFRKALSLNPRFFEFYYNLGVIYFKLGQYQQASEVLKKAMRIEPQTTVASLMSSREIYWPLLINESGDSRQNYPLEEQIKTSYRNGAILFIQSLLGLKDFKQALYYAQESIRSTNGNRAIFYYYAGMALQAQGQADMAEKFFQKGELLHKMNPLWVEAEIDLRIF